LCRVHAINVCLSVTQHLPIPARQKTQPTQTAQAGFCSRTEKGTSGKFKSKRSFDGQRRQRVRPEVAGPKTGSAPCPPKPFGKLRCPAIGGSRSKAERFFYACTRRPRQRSVDPLR